MRHWLASLFLLICGLSSLAQNANDWVEYSQQYLRFDVTEKGVYRIYYGPLNTALQGIGVDLDVLDPQSFQIYSRGEEMAIWVEGEDDGSFDQNDFIEFYATGNDGWLDTALYGNPANQPNPYYSLITDTARYFFTWTPGTTNNLRATAQTEQAPGAHPVADYILKESLQVYSEKHYDGQKDVFGKSNSDYSQGEGWFRTQFVFQQYNSVSLSTPYPYTGTGAPDATGRILFCGTNNPQENPDKAIITSYSSGPSSYSTVDTTIFDGYGQYDHTFDINPFDVGVAANSTTVVRLINDTLALPGSVPSVSYAAIAFASVTYARQPNFGGNSEFEFRVPASGSAFTVVQATNFTSSPTDFVWDITGKERITVPPQSGSNITFLVSGGPEKSIYVATNGSINTISDFVPVNGDGSFVNFNNVAEEDLYIIISHPLMWSSAQAYRDYRIASDYNVLLADIEHLYDQFAYGVRKHPSAIREFARYMIQEAATPPDHMFLIGKSIYDKKCRQNATNFENNLVPTWGFPASDVFYTSYMNGTILEPAIPTGRLAAKSNQEVLSYLNKVQEWESEQDANLAAQTIDNRAWMKRIIHFGGGNSEGEHLVFKTYLDSYEDTIESPKYGGWVYSFYKNTTDPIQQNVTDSVIDLINNGVSLMTFFGHASGSSFDISIGLPEDYNNSDGRYPLIVANSCNAGDIHTEVVGGFASTSEAFVLHERGSIGFIASTSLGYATQLNYYTRAFYSQLANKNYGGTIGRSMANAVAFIQGNGTIDNLRSTCLEMNLHGDPGIRMPVFDAPDYATQSDLVYFEPATPSTDNETFTMNVRMHNLGMATNDSVRVEVKRIFPDGSNLIIDTLNPPIWFDDTLRITFPVDIERGPGLNRFEVFIDPLDFYSELSETNNNITLTGIELWISSDEVVPVYPYEFAVVPNKDVTLRGSTADPLTSDRTYVFQIDTTDTFDSPALQQGSVTNAAGVVSWSPGSSYYNPFPDSTVFFWRTSPEPQGGQDYRWRERSFQYIPDREGWSQDHFFQFKDNDYLYIEHNRNNREFEFLPIVRSIECNNLGNPTSATVLDNIEFKIDGAVIESNMCGFDPSVYIAVIDSTTLQPWGTHKILDGVEYNHNNSFGNANDLNGCRSYRVESYFRFLVQSNANMNGLIDMVSNQVPNGNYLLMYTGNRGLFQDSTIWTDARLAAFEALGADSISSVGDSIPYIFFVQKGHPDQAIEVIGNSPTDFIQLSTTISNNFFLGKMTSPVIGPALQWGSFHWDEYPLEANSADTVHVNVVGVKLNNDKDTLMRYAPVFSDVLQLDTLVDANLYPYLELTAYTRDDQTQTPAQIENWMVLYDQAPDASLDASAGYFQPDAEVDEGQTLQLAFPIRNVSAVDMDSLRVKYWIQNRQNQVFEIPYPKQDSLRVGDVLLDTVEASTIGFEGFNSLWIEVNPQDSLWQPEQYHFNNTARIAFNVTTDNVNPILDVTFDGIHILDGDIVSPQPSIVISVDDENQYLALADTSDVQVYLTDPEGNTQPIYFVSGNGTEQLAFTPGDLPKNKSTIEYNPIFTLDGEYKLSVYGQDASGNAAGEFNYEISFEVIQQSTITQVLNYPNPFSTSTRFVFTLTGSEVPDLFRIQILTVTGKVVREITEAEFGPINIGRNISEFAWDGTDEYGDPLANGVYLYRVITKIDREAIDHRDSNADQFFHKGFGKMYLMR